MHLRMLSGRWRPSCSGRNVLNKLWSEWIHQHHTAHFCTCTPAPCHYDVIKWKHFPRYWPFVRGIQWSPANSPHKDQWRGTLMFFFICAWTNGWINHGDAGDLRRSLWRHCTLFALVHHHQQMTRAQPWTIINFLSYMVQQFYQY